MRFIEIPALITEDIEDPNIVDITEPITVSISGTTLTIDGGSKVSGEASVTLTGDVTVNAFTLQNVKQPSLHKISVKTNRKGNFTYVPNDTVTASSVSTTTKTGSDFEILLITTTGGETYVDFDMADYVSPALYTSNALTGFDISELTSTYGATAKLYKPDGTLLTTVTSATTGDGVNFGYTESTPQDVTYTLEVEDDLGRTSRYDLPRKWISYAMSSPGFEKLELAGNEYTTTTIVPNISPSSKAKVFRTNNHGYLGINFKIQGRNSTGDDWVDIANADEDDEVLAFGDYLYHRVWVKPTAKATTTVSSSNVVTITLSNLTEENVTTSFTGADPFDINESTNTYVFEETTKIGTVPYTVTLGSETYTNAVTVTTEGTAYDYVTLAFANPTLSLTTSNVTISSAKLYRDDVLFHTYGTESNVVLRTDQTGTYQAVVNDVYYSNRVTPDFTTTRSVSAPQLEFDGYNKLTLANYITTTSDFPSIITFDVSAWSGAPTTIWYVLDTTKSTDTSKFYETNAPTTGDAGNDGTATGIEFRCESDGTTKVYANTDDNTGQPSTLNVNSTSYPSNYVDGVTVTSGDVLYGVEGSFTRFGFTVTSSMLFTRTVITPTSTTLGLPDGTTRDLTTQSKVYIYETGTYTANVQTSETFAYLSNVVTGEITIKTSNSYNLFQNFGTTDYTDTEGRTIEKLNSYSNGNLSGSDLASWTDRGWTYSGTINLHNDAYNVTGITGDISTNFHGSGSTTGYFDKTLPSNATGIIIRFGQTYNNSTGRAQVFIYNNGTEVTSTSSKSYSTTLTEETLYFAASPNNVIRLHESGTGVFAVTHILTETYTVTPKLTFDGYNKLTLENLTQTSSTLKYGSNTYDTNTASNVYVTDTGEYVLEARDANTFVMSNVYVGALDTQVDYTNLTSMYYGGAVTDVNGVLYTWGHDGYGDSGRGASDRIPTAITSISDPVSNVWRGDPGYTMAAKTSTDKWYMWGRNTYSAVLGNTTNTGNVTVPEDVTAKVTTYFGDQTVSANKIIKMAMGEHHAVALTAGGKVWSWGGDATYYATGTGTNDNTVLVTPVQLNRSPPISGQTGYEITNTNSAVSTLKIRANGSIFTFNSQTCWYYDRLAGSNNTWYTQQLGYVPSTNTFIEASISGNPDQVYHNKTSSNVTKGSITVPPEGILLSNDPGSWNGAALFANPFTSTSDPLMTGITNVEAVYHGTAALDSSGNVWFWGGASTSMQYAYPTKLLDSSSIPGIVGLRATNKYSLFTWKSDGTFYTRGAGPYGPLATGSETDQYASWQTVTTLQGKTIKKVYGGNENMFVWTDDGVYGVGRGNNYKLGNGSTSNKSTFHKSNTLSALSIKEIDFGHATGLVLTTDGKGYMWGEDASNSMANALSGHQSGAAEATSISALSLVHIPSPSITYDGKNKLTVGGTNYADTATVSDPNGSIHEIGTAKTMYVKDTGEYVFKISGTDKYVESNVYVSSVDLAGATTKPIDFDGYNKLTLIDAGSNVSANVTYFSNTYEMGSAKEFYIKDQ